MKKTILKMDSQALTAFQQCPHKHQLAFIESLELKRGPPEYIVEGLVFHAMLDRYYNSKILKKDFKTCVAAGLEISKPIKENDSIKTREDKELFINLSADVQLLCITKFSEYCNYWRSEKLIPVGVEVGFSKTLYETEHYHFIYEGRIDLIVRDEKSNLSFTDHKKQRRKDTLFKECNQFFGYAFALDSLTGQVNYVGFQESLKPEECFYRSLISFRPDQIEDWKQSAIETFFEVAKANANGHFLKRRAACQGKYGFCQFHELCRQTNANVIKFQKKTDFQVRKPWTPWE